MSIIVPTFALDEIRGDEHEGMGTGTLSCVDPLRNRRRLPHRLRTEFRRSHASINGEIVSGNRDFTLCGPPGEEIRDLAVS